MNNVFISVWTEVNGVKELRYAVPCEEADAHDVLRDFLIACGVERPDHAIIAGGPVPDASGTYNVHWRVADPTPSGSLTLEEIEQIKKHSDDDEGCP